MDCSVHPPNVSVLHIQLDGWLGDELLETFPCYIVSLSLLERIWDATLTGVNFTNVQVFKSETFNEMYPNKDLPEFFWMTVEGKPGVDDFGVYESTLIASQRALDVLSEAKIPNCEFKHWSMDDSNQASGWTDFDSGSSIGSGGSEGGVIVKDEEHELGARITLEDRCSTGPIGITCGIYASMVHTTWASAMEDGLVMYQAMKVELSEILASGDDDSTRIAAFV
ncbi:hypothetical protein OAU50_08960, partial [Planctomycetota bacterium]|nr:hypothetical protein [Planctomycetota bacterium]